MAQIHPLKTKTKLISHPGVRREDPPSAVHLHSEARNGKQIQAILSFESKERRSWVPRGPGSSKCRVLRMGSQGVWEQRPAGAGASRGRAAQCLVGGFSQRPTAETFF